MRRALRCCCTPAVSRPSRASSSASRPRSSASGSPRRCCYCCWRGKGWGRQVAPLTLLLTTLLFFVVDLGLAMQVRYFYFALPLALAAIAILLGRVAARGRWARLVGWALVLALLLQGAIAWSGAAFGEIQISMTPLTH